MTPNPNPSPELNGLIETLRQIAYHQRENFAGPAEHGAWCIEVAAIAYESAVAALSQTLPAPGEVDHIAGVGNMVEVERVRRAIWVYFHTLDDAAQSLPVVTFLSNRDVFLAEAIAPATVAAANDEGVAEQEYASGYKQAIEDAAKAVNDLRRLVPYDYNQHPCSETKRRAIAAIRLLSQGAGK